jgi:hypothetical protein
MESRSVDVARPGTPEAELKGLSNNGVIIRLLQTPNHLSRWLTPIHDRTLLEFSPRRAQPSAKDVLVRMRDTETRSYALMYAIATGTNPDLDRLPELERSPQQIATDQAAHPLVIMSEFRRLRESSTSLLRALPDTAWERGGYSRRNRNWTIRELAEFLLSHDRRMLADLDDVLAQNEAREGIAAVSRVEFGRLEEPFVSPATRDAR